MTILEAREELWRVKEECLAQKLPATASPCSDLADAFVAINQKTEEDVRAILRHVEEGKPLPKMTPYEVEMVFRRLDMACIHSELICQWHLFSQKTPSGELPAMQEFPRRELLAWLLEEMWSHIGFGTIHDILLAADARAVPPSDSRNSSGN